MDTKVKPIIPFEEERAVAGMAEAIKARTLRNADSDRCNTRWDNYSYNRPYWHEFAQPPKATERPINWK